MGIGWGRILGVEGGGETAAGGEDAKERYRGLRASCLVPACSEWHGGIHE